MTIPIRSADYALALGPGTRLVQYEIERVLGQGSFGITYLASEPLLGDLGEKVAIKEFLPCDLAGRATDRDTVLPHTPERRDLFQHGLEKFLEEARRLKLLSKGSPPNIVRVRTAFEANGTAYLVMDYYEGKTLTAYVRSITDGGDGLTSRRLDPDDAVTTMVQILRGLAAVHDKGFVHRDVKPDNIYLRFREDGTREALLLDFGAARQALLEQKRTADWTVVLSRGYAPPEQYQRSGEQGPWTDIYACAAVLYQLITGVVPPDADLRERVAEGRLKGEDVELVPPRQLAPDCTPGVDAAILRALSLDPRERPQTALEFIHLLEGGVEVPVPAPEESSSRTVMLEHSATVVLDEPSPPRHAAPPPAADSGRQVQSVESSSPASAPSPRTGRMTRPGGRLAAVVALALVAGSIGAATYFAPWGMPDLGASQLESPEVNSEELIRDPASAMVGSNEPEDPSDEPDATSREEPPVVVGPQTLTTRDVPGPRPSTTPASNTTGAETPPARPVVTTPGASELRPLAEALVLGNVHLEGQRFDQADRVVRDALASVAQLNARYPRADTLRTLQRALVELRDENRVNCRALAEVVGGNCPGGGN